MGVDATTEKAPLLPAVNDVNQPSSSRQIYRRRIVRLLIPAILLHLSARLGLFGWFSLSTASSDGIDWKPCFDNKAMQCARVGVPTDHDDPSYGTTYLSMVKVPADSGLGPRLGSVYTNFGGPGASGRQMAIGGYGKSIQDTVGGRFDIICYDPRGIGRTTPNVNCFGNQANQSAVLRNTIMDRTMEVPSDPWSPEGRAMMIQQQKEALRLMELQAGVCGENVGAETLKWMGTTTLIRDIEYLKNKIDGEDALINFHGGSYGTVVAEYLVNMLPDKVGAVIAHGVADPPTWANERYETYTLLGELLGDADIAFDGWMKACHIAGPGRCALSRDSDDSHKAIARRFETLLTRLEKEGGSVVHHESTQGILTSGMIRGTFFEMMQQPESWSAYAEALAPALEDEPDYLPLFKHIPSKYNIESRPKAADGYMSIGQSDLARLAVSCADNPPFEEKSEDKPTAEQVIDNLLNKTFPVTTMFGGTIHLQEQHGGCQFWPQSSKPVKRFSGPFGSKLRTPMLVVSNDLDPITPAKVGREMAGRYNESNSARHLIQRRIGHSYIVSATECYKAIAKRYFEERVLPDDFETYCNGSDSSENFPALEAGSLRPESRTRSWRGMAWQGQI